MEKFSDNVLKAFVSIDLKCKKKGHLLGLCLKTLEYYIQFKLILRKGAATFHLTSAKVLAE